MAEEENEPTLTLDPGYHTPFSEQEENTDSDTDLINTTQDELVTGEIDVENMTDVSWDWSLTLETDISNIDPKDHFDVYVSEDTKNTLIVEYFNKEGLLRIDELNYITDENNVETVQLFSELPEPSLSPEIIKVKADDIDYISFSVDVTASGTAQTDTSTETEATVSDTFYIYIYTNRDIVRDALIDEINQRNDQFFRSNP